MDFIIYIVIYILGILTPIAVAKTLETLPKHRMRLKLVSDRVNLEDLTPSIEEIEREYLKMMGELETEQDEIEG